jgi:RNA-directed DNA polymerase
VRRQPQKTRLVHISQGFEGLGYKVKQGTGHRLPAAKRRGRSNPHQLSTVPREKSGTRFREQSRKLTRRKAPLTLQALLARSKPVMRGWGTF